MGGHEEVAPAAEAAAGEVEVQVLAGGGDGEFVHCGGEVRGELVGEGGEGGCGGFGFGEEAFQGCGAVGEGGDAGGVDGDGVVEGAEPGELDAAAAEVHGDAADVGEGARDAKGADAAFFFLGQHFDGPAGVGFDGLAIGGTIEGCAGGFGGNDADVGWGDGEVGADGFEVEEGGDD